ncbi:FAD-dependent oxidoreductase [Actinokineospora enzanensis]|uniref:FAD-dependent oxidoreductase n=1 Tax=Actinokineospora enzanensis TaxID=155975 RepID=UPI000380A6D9|nr:FAD-dependent oxidoreductase [Actinokineospora enzanensis]
MTRIVVVGGGMAGLSAALFCARRGHRVTVLERDVATAPDGPDTAFDAWHRPGVPQARHSHKFLGRSCRVLEQEAPDVLDALLRAGAARVPVSRFDAGRGEFTDYALAARRLAYEAVLRRAADREPGVVVRAGARVVGLATVAGDVPRVTGVRLDRGEVVSGDLVVDAGGRHTRLADGLDLPNLPSPEVHTCGFVYLTRHYRLLPGQEIPALDRPLATSLGYAATLAFPADSRTFSLSVTLSTEDPMRHALRNPEVWDRFVDAVPHTARWAVRGVPEGPVHMMSRIENRRQRLAGPDGPAVVGLVLLGDAALQTNPTYGRGVSLAFAHAQQLAGGLEFIDDPYRFAVEFDEWTERNLGVWYRTQIVADSAGLARMAAGLRGERPDPPTDPFARLMAGMEDLAARDEVVGRGLGRMAHLLITPTQLLGDREVVQRVVAHLGDRPLPAEQLDGPDRAEFEGLAGVSGPMTGVS